MEMQNSQTLISGNNKLNTKMVSAFATAKTESSTIEKAKLIFTAIFWLNIPSDIICNAVDSVTQTWHLLVMTKAFVSDYSCDHTTPQQGYTTLHR